VGISSVSPENAWIEDSLAEGSEFEPPVPVSTDHGNMGVGCTENQRCGGDYEIRVRIHTENPDSHEKAATASAHAARSVPAPGSSFSSVWSNTQHFTALYSHEAV
jgi:hypothetical protein